MLNKTIYVIKEKILIIFISFIIVISLIVAFLNASMIYYLFLILTVIFGVITYKITKSKLNESDESIGFGVNIINQGKNSIQSNYKDLIQNLEKLSSKLEHTASTVEQLTSTVKNTADNTQKANKLSQNTVKLTNEGMTLSQSLKEAISDISVSSQKIVDIIALVNKIAFQTNILAINAAIEAAKAGEQGKGFAVVAIEVRNLAQRSADSAKEIKSIITTTIDKIKSGADLVDLNVGKLGEIVKGIETVSTLINEISSATKEQYSAIEQINYIVTDIDSTSQTSATIADKTSQNVNHVFEHIENQLLKVSSHTANQDERAYGGLQLESLEDTKIETKTINWSPKYAVNIKSIDDQHKGLFEIANNLFEAMSKNKSRDVISHIMDELLNYTKSHLTFEEEMMKKFNYSDFPNHKKLHEALISKVMDYKTKFDGGDTNISIQLSLFIKEWLKNHIQKIDKKYSEYLISKGAK